MRFLVWVFFFGVVSGKSWGREVATCDSLVVRDSVVMTEAVSQVLKDSVPQSFLDKLNDYYNAWYLSKLDSVVYADSVSFAESLRNIPVCSDSLYLLRIDSMQSAIPLSFNEIVRNYIELYTVKRRAQVAVMLGAARYYFPIFEEALDAECMPLELRCLPVIESALNPRAMSRVGACGLWQFMYSTGRMYKLEINSFVDERRDPYLSTKAAVRYLNDLYSIYEDWILVVAAYNCGPGNVNKAIRRSGGKKNYWDIYYYLPKETRGYVPAFIAANYVFRYYKEHGIYPIEPTLPVMCDSIMLGDAVHFEQIAAQLNLSVEQLRDLNPQYRADVVPAGFGRTYALRMPYSHIHDFIDRQDTIFAHNRSKYFNDNDRTADPRNRIRVNASALGTDGRVRLVYTVKSGDVPGAIALKFNVRLVDLKYWNNLNSRLTIRPGQKLVLYVPEKKAEQYRSKAAYAGKVNNTVSAPAVETIDGEFILYTVKKGENLWTIAKKYPGVSNRDIMRWNGLTDDDVRGLKPGQKLKIKI
ncbi:MAG: LysM peptidoglycan-binding domain-containing protein [Odoribacter sp.]|nr:LysM peptidoglycan-binding domain-containing protein [Odoribacter sp.]